MNDHQTTKTARVAALLSTIEMKTAATLDRKEVEKLAFGSPDGTPSIYQDWWDDKPHQILARVLRGHLS